MILAGVVSLTLSLEETAGTIEGECGPAYRADALIMAIWTRDWPTAGLVDTGRRRFREPAGQDAEETEVQP